MNGNLSHGALVALVVTVLGCIVGDVVLIVLGYATEAAALLIGVPVLVAALVAALSSVSAHVTASKTHEVVEQLANGGTEQIVRKVVGTELTRLASAQQTGKPYVPPKVVDLPAPAAPPTPAPKRRHGLL